MHGPKAAFLETSEKVSHADKTSETRNNSEHTFLRGGGLSATIRDVSVHGMHLHTDYLLIFVWSACSSGKETFFLSFAFFLLHFVSLRCNV